MSVSTVGGPAGDTPQAPGWGLFAQWHALIDDGDPRFTLLAPMSELEEPLARLGSSVRVSMWNAQRQWSIYAMRSSAEVDEGMRRRGVELRLVLPRRITERRCPLASSHEPELRLAPVGHPLMVLDRRLLVVADAAGDSLWTSSAPEVIAQATGLYERLWQAAEPAVPEGEEPPFTRRMVEIAFLLVDGATDREIARSLGVSERTVSADIREMSRRLGARSRAQAIARISGHNG